MITAPICVFDGVEAPLGLDRVLAAVTARVVDLVRVRVRVRASVGTRARAGVRTAWVADHAANIDHVRGSLTVVEGERLAVRAALAVGHAGVRRRCDQVVLRKLGDRAVERLAAEHASARHARAEGDVELVREVTGMAKAGHGHAAAAPLVDLQRGQADHAHHGGRRHEHESSSSSTESPPVCVRADADAAVRAEPPRRPQPRA
eukprot:scaffold52955_cov45-Phaeocystis_antarctica.AAC.2